MPDQKEHILKAALAEFIDRGFEGARMQAIAERAEVNKAMLHYYFSSKENLYEQCLSFIFASIHGSTFKAMIDSEKLDQLIEALIQIIFDFHKIYPGFFKIIMREAMGGMEMFRKMDGMELHGIGMSERLMLMQKKIISLQKQGEIRQDMPWHHVMLLMIGSIIVSVVHSFFIPSIVPDKAAALMKDYDKSVKKILIDGLKPQKARG